MKQKYLKRLLLLSGLLFSTSLLTACGGNTLWSHPSKSLTDLYIDDKACAKLAYAIAKEQSLVKQPNIHVLQESYSQCLISQGWRPTAATPQAPRPATPVTISTADNNVRFSAKKKQIELQGPIQIISQDQHGALLKKEAQFIFLNIQYNSPYTFTQTYPALLPDTNLFDQHQDKNTWTTFYYQEAGDKLVFGCMAYILPEKNSRIVISITQEVFAKPADFLEISQQEYSQLLLLQDSWLKLIEEIYQQS